MNGDVIKSFLVGLGFGVDDASLSKFNKAIASASLRVAALYGAIQTASAGIVLGISEISDGFEKMGYEFHLIAPAINRAIYLRQELLKAYAAAGINIQKVIQSSIRLNLSLEKTKYAFQAIYRSVASRFFDIITKQSDLFRQKIYANMPRIQNILEHLIKFIFKAFDALATLGSRLWSILTRVYDFFVMLDKATEGWSTIILGVIAAWKLLNLSFLATPLGLLITGFAALLALWDDFKTFQEGGKSLFNWGPFVSVINAVTEALKDLYAVYDALGDTIDYLISAFASLFKGDAIKFWDSMAAAVLRAVTSLKSAFGLIGGIGNVLESAANWIDHALGSPTQAQLNAQSVGSASGPTRPMVNPATAGTQTNQNVQQQTTVNVHSSADAGAVGKAVSGEQGKVNFDMARNLKARAT